VRAIDWTKESPAGVIAKQVGTVPQTGRDGTGLIELARNDTFSRLTKRGSRRPRGILSL